MMHNLFVHNADGSLKRKLPCQTPGCKWPNWHICLDTTDPEHKRVHAIRPLKKAMTQAHKDAIAAAQRERHARRREAMLERDTLIIKHYVEGNLGMSKIATLMGLAQSTVNKVLNQAAKAGEITIRPKHMTNYRPGN